MSLHCDNRGTGATHSSYISSFHAIHFMSYILQTSIVMNLKSHTLQPSFLPNIMHIVYKQLHCSPGLLSGFWDRPVLLRFKDHGQLGLAIWQRASDHQGLEKWAWPPRFAPAEDCANLNSYMV